LIESLKDLEKLLRVLRKQGVYEFEHNGTKLKIGDLPRDPITTDGMLTPEQLIFYSAGGSPEDDPENKQ
jgi:hypothetical protein